MPISHGQLLEAKYLLGLSKLIYKGSAEAAEVLGQSMVKAIPISNNGSECLLALTESKIMVVFQGTKDAVDVVRDLSFHMHRVCGGKVHGGFLEAYRQVEDLLLSAMEELNPDRIFPVHVTGHSLGGAMAAQAILALKIRGHVIAESYVSAAPKVGDSDWCRMFNSLHIPLYNIVHNLDAVPMLPPFPYFKTSGSRVYLSDDGVFTDSRQYTLRFLSLSFWDWILRVPAAHGVDRYVTAVNAALARYAKEGIQ